MDNAVTVVLIFLAAMMPMIVGFIVSRNRNKKP